MKSQVLAKRGAAVSSLAGFAVGFVCLACLLPGIGAIIGISVLVTAVGGIADDGVLTVVGVAALVVSITLAAYVVVARRRDAQACAVDELQPDTATEPPANTPVATHERHV